jgi:hypothetical protein
MAFSLTKSNINQLMPATFSSPWLMATHDVDSNARTQIIAFLLLLENPDTALLSSYILYFKPDTQAGGKLLDTHAVRTWCGCCKTEA